MLSVNLRDRTIHVYSGARKTMICRRLRYSDFSWVSQIIIMFIFASRYNIISL